MSCPSYGTLPFQIKLHVQTRVIYIQIKSRKLHSLKRSPVGTRYPICVILGFRRIVKEISLFWGVTQRRF